MTSFCLGEVACTCNCNCGQQKTESAEETTPLTPEEKYEEWFKFAYNVTYSQYAHYTWIKELWGYSKSKVYYDVSFLLNDNPLSWTAKQFELKKLLDDDTIKHMYIYLTTAKQTLEALLITHNSLEIPQKYIDADNVVITVIETLLNYRDSLAKHIEENKTTENMPTKPGDDLSRNVHLLGFLVDLL